MPLLTPGISGFGSTAEIGLTDFKRAVYAAAHREGAVVTAFVVHDGVTPSFHQASVTFGAESLLILCNRYRPIIAFPDRLENASVGSFISAPKLFAEVMVSFGVVVADAAELNRRLNAHDLESLSPVERQQVKYWKPKRVGDIIFHWWD